MKQKYDPQKHKRQSMRLKGYDYTSYGAYFITICTHRGQNTFGDVVDFEMHNSELGQIVEAQWLATGEQRQSHVRLDDYQVMPNHFHAIIWIVRDEEGFARQTGTEDDPSYRYFGRPQKKALGTIMGSFKASVTRVAKEECDDLFLLVWHRNFYDHIIRSEEDLKRIRTYIRNNPARWMADLLHPDAADNKFNAIWRRKGT